MVVPKEVKQKENEIIGEFKKLGLRVTFKVNNVDPKTGAWEHNVGFHDVLSKEESDKVWNIIRKHFEEWKNSHS